MLFTFYNDFKCKFAVLLQTEAHEQDMTDNTNKFCIIAKLLWDQTLPSKAEPHREVAVVSVQNV